MKRRRLLALAGAAVAAPSLARAEAAELRVAHQFGLGYLQFMLMDDRKLVEKHAAAAGLAGVKATYAAVRSSDVINDGLISGAFDFGCLGIPGIATIWSRTRGNVDVRGVSGLNSLPLILLTRNPAVNGVADFTDKDRIALPAVKVSMQAILLQMLAVRQFGEAQIGRFDPLTVSMAHPDATAAMLGGVAEITANFSSAPFQYRQMKDPKIRKLVSSNDIVGGRMSFNVIGAPAKFRDANPKLHRAFLAALDEATAIINADKRAAAEFYLKAANDRSPVEEILAIMNDPEVEFTTKPLNIQPMLDFIVKTGTLRARPDRWQDLFFPEAVA
jgi:NitT/TauT family transport system substrate-binding protein